MTENLKELVCAGAVLRAGRPTRWTPGRSRSWQAHLETLWVRFAWQAQYLERAGGLAWTAGRFRSAAALCVAGAVLGEFVAALCVAGAVLREDQRTCWTGRPRSAPALCVAGAVLKGTQQRAPRKSPSTAPATQRAAADRERPGVQRVCWLPLSAAPATQRAATESPSTQISSNGHPWDACRGLTWRTERRKKRYTTARSQNHRIKGATDAEWLHQGLPGPAKRPHPQH